MNRFLTLQTIASILLVNLLIGSTVLATKQASLGFLGGRNDDNNIPMSQPKSISNNAKNYNINKKILEGLLKALINDSVDDYIQEILDDETQKNRDRTKQFEDNYWVCLYFLRL